LRDNFPKKPLFSIIMASYNRAHLLPRAIKSVLNQTYQNFELIIVDDGSTDDTEQGIQTFEDDGRIIYRKFVENKGMLAARNKGLDLARGDYVALLDSDDELLPEALETAANKFADLSPQGVGVIWFDDIDFVTKRVTGKGLDKDGYISYEDHICGKVQGDFWDVIERSVLGGLRFDERTWDASLLWFKFYPRTRVFHAATALYLVHREHGSTRTYDFRFELMHKEKFLLARKVFLAEHGQEVRRLCPGAYASNLVVLGFYHILNGEKLEGRRALVESLKFHFSLQAAILALLSCILNEKQIAFLFGQYKKARFLIMKGRWLWASFLKRGRRRPWKTANL